MRTRRLKWFAQLESLQFSASRHKRNKKPKYVIKVTKTGLCTNAHLTWILTVIIFSWKFVHTCTTTMQRNSRFKKRTPWLSFNCKVFQETDENMENSQHDTVSSLFSWVKHLVPKVLKCIYTRICFVFKKCSSVLWFQSYSWHHKGSCFL